MLTNLSSRYSGKGAVLGSLTNSQSVSFRQGTNVEFGPTAFNNGPGGIGGGGGGVRLREDTWTATIRKLFYFIYSLL